MSEDSDEETENSDEGTEEVGTRGDKAKPEESDSDAGADYERGDNAAREDDEDDEDDEE